MNLKINKCEYEEIREEIENYYIKKNILIDSFLEDHILNSNHYKIIINDKFAGYFSVFEKQLLTGFFIEEEFRNESQEIFFVVRKYEEIKEAFVPTSNEFFLSHALDNYTKIEKQAYFSKDSKRKIENSKIDSTIKFSKNEKRTGKGKPVLFFQPEVILGLKITSILNRKKRDKPAKSNIRSCHYEKGVLNKENSLFNSSLHMDYSVYFLKKDY